MDLLQELHAGSMSAAPHAVADLTSATTDPCARHIHMAMHCLPDKLPKALELLSRRLRSNDWCDRKRISTILAAEAAGHWSANGLSHDGEENERH